MGLIIEIFNAHAETKEAKLQVQFIYILDCMLLCHISCGSIQSLVICIILNINEKNRTLIFIYLFHFVVCLVQSELAALMYMKTRLVRVRGPGGKLAFGASGEAEVVSARGYASF